MKSPLPTNTIEKILKEFKIGDYIDLFVDGVEEAGYIFDKPKFDEWLASKLQEVEEEGFKRGELRLI